MKSVAHSYAAAALSCVEKAGARPKAEEYGRLCHIFPSMVLVNGLRLTVAYFRSKAAKEKIYEIFLRDLGLALEVPDWNTGIPESMADYRELTGRALKACVWFKRYAEAVLRIEQTHEHGDF
ncbi:type III-B CRISPR module-associated protein Cmr5 [Paenibacillus sp. S150]|uniref:type III-B CRISPR module-associated protein Cmr5 n=1 Tax=Paenibacillus sp. S150 TaxID=2749826 RepID=UPI001C566099|nr:type III-B CRISPR module-associated protein Cmr5 [Paenibacillus sp. S150]MBW4082505.1 type III-B CRISPR module-associated protein Cmr5 [Paenibacillus sp. S150]